MNGQHGGHECCACRSERREYEFAMDVEREVVLGSVGVLLDRPSSPDDSAGTSGLGSGLQNHWILPSSPWLLDRAST
eukprot:221713-Hanusia_phi.AAC.1